MPNPINDQDILDRMVEIKTQIAKLQDELQSLQPQFYLACEKQGVERIEVEGALIHRTLTPGQWKYPDALQKLERQLKLDKKIFRSTHEPIAGREPMWAIRLR